MKIHLGNFRRLWFIKGMMLRLFLILPVLFLSACGFSPVYGTLGTGQDYGREDLLSYISIANIPNREGQFLRNELIDRFYRNEGRPTNPQFRLDVQNLREIRRDLDITESSDSTRGQLRLTATMQLYDMRTNEVLMERKLQAVSSYNIMGSEYATRISEQNNRENALRNLARQIETHVVLHFRNTVSKPVH